MPRTPRKKPPIRWRPRPLPIAATAVAAFVGLTGFLGLRAAQGEDPALGTGSASTAQVRSSTPSSTSSGSSASGRTSSQTSQNPSTGTSGG